MIVKLKWRCPLKWINSKPVSLIPQIYTTVKPSAINQSWLLKLKEIFIQNFTREIFIVPHLTVWHSQYDLLFRHFTELERTFGLRNVDSCRSTKMVKENRVTNFSSVVAQFNVQNDGESGYKDRCFNISTTQGLSFHNCLCFLVPLHDCIRKEYIYIYGCTYSVCYDASFVARPLAVPELLERWSTATSSFPFTTCNTSNVRVIERQRSFR